MIPFVAVMARPMAMAVVPSLRASTWLTLESAIRCDHLSEAINQCSRTTIRTQAHVQPAKTHTKDPREGRAVSAASSCGQHGNCPAPSPNGLKPATVLHPAQSL